MTAKKLTNWMLAADLLWTLLAFAGAGFLRYGLRWGIDDRLAVYTLLPFLATSMGLWVLLFHRFHLDGFHGGWRFSAVASRLLLAILCLMGGLLATAYLARQYVSRLVLVYFGILLFVGFLFLRYFVSQRLRARRRMGDVSRIVVVGSGSIAREVAIKIDRHPEMLCEIVGFLFPDDGPIDMGGFLETNGEGARRISTLGIVDLLRTREVDELILALSRPTSAELLTLTARCREAGIRVSLIPQPYELYFSKPVLLDLDGLPLLQLNDPIPSQFFLRCKRSIDLVLGAVLSLLAMPIILPVSAVLRATKGKAFSWDTRCGQHGHHFEMLRLNVARRTGNTTRFEKLLEGLSITELPQLWNVLRGQMSLIGPRPESPNRAKRYTDWQQRRLSVKPGITGLAQVHGLRDYSSSEDKTRYDLQYLLYPSLLVDISLLLQTIWTLVLRVGRAARLVVRGDATASMTSNVESTLSEEVYSVAHRSQPGSDQLRWRRD
jgi:lipopolysaccharide/colanic/teichoic acid biosynthesis glycosyltransferase